jgi:hypothetical protein
MNTATKAFGKTLRPPTDTTTDTGVDLCFPVRSLKPTPVCVGFRSVAVDLCFPVGSLKPTPVWVGFRPETHAHWRGIERFGWTPVCVGLGRETIGNGAPRRPFSPLTGNPATTSTELGRETRETHLFSVWKPKKCERS